MCYIVEVQVTEYTASGPQKVWKAMRPTGGAPYYFNTRREAEDAMRLHPSFYERANCIRVANEH